MTPIDGMCKWNSDRLPASRANKVRIHKRTAEGHPARAARAAALTRFSRAAVTPALAGCAANKVGSVGMGQVELGN